MKYSDYNFEMNDVIFQGNTIDDCLFIDWCILYECNYKCSYCFGQDTLSNAQFTPLDKLKYAVDNIFKIHKSRYAFTLTGGEVTYYPYLLDLVNYILGYNKNTSIYIITNGSRSIEYFEDLFSKYVNSKITLTISIHLEYAKYEHIQNIIKLANRYNKRIRLSLMLHPYMYKEVKEFYYNLIDLRKSYVFDINLAELRGGNSFDMVDNRYTEEYLSWCDIESFNCNNIENKSDDILPINWGPKPYYKIINNEKNIRIDHYKAMRENKKKFTGFYCCGGINAISILSNGDYKAGNCGDFPIIGNIFNTGIDYEKLFNFTVCTKYECGCRANDCIPKFRNLEDAIDYTNKTKIRYILNIFTKDINEVIKINENINNHIDVLINIISWWIPFKKWRESFRNKFKK
ncbi:radical SAM protein [Brachyspira pilosicoli]|uniref:radical SAM protein n=1 Tax=Brachyspira pilosicoli TaxID=52584 RepID=UPI0012F5038A|nr:radical SAM protein [Brachyspira pilosicoli]